mgnify:CR=1 FL=1
MRYCPVCGRKDILASEMLGACVDCLRTSPDLLHAVHQRRAEARRAWDLPQSPPRTPGGRKCALCVNECQMGEGETSYCGLRTVVNGRLTHLAGTPRGALLHFYHDPLPTNCVADPFCNGRTRFGYANLAVFYGACTFDCFYCQNWHFRQMSVRDRLISADELAAQAAPRTACVCYFGGDPAAQMPHALAVSRLLIGRGLHICWETNGSMHPALLDQAVKLSLASGGCIKFDLKAWDRNLHQALTGADNTRTLENFARAARRTADRPDSPLVIASTLLVPGYVDAQEVGAIARYIASLDRRIPYVLLAFAPNHLLSDLPCTSSQQARAAEDAARDAGLLTVRIGNRHLLDADW